MPLQAVDIVVAFTAAQLQQERGSWQPAEVRSLLDLPWASLHQSLRRLSDAGVVRDGSVSRLALVALLPALRHLFPLRVDEGRQERGVPTSFASPVFENRVRYSVPYVWPDATGDTIGCPVAPLHRSLPAAARKSPQVGHLFALVDAVRGGRAREVEFAHGKLRELLGLPAPYVEQQHHDRGA